MLALALIGGLFLAANFIVIMWKFRKERYEDAALDFGAAVVMTLVFGGTLVGTAIAMVGSALFSLYLFMFPPKPIGKSNTKKGKGVKSGG